MASKIKTNQQLLKEYKDSNDLVFVSGCFDVIHFGHIKFLREAKRSGGTLLAVTHDDESIKNKKGNNRPINPLGYRMEVLAELESVDLVSSWNGWESIAEFVKELSPAKIAVTEGSFSNKTVQSIADEIGAELIVIPFQKEISTTNILNKLEL